MHSEGDPNSQSQWVNYHVALFLLYWQPFNLLSVIHGVHPHLDDGESAACDRQAHPSLLIDESGDDGGDDDGLCSSYLILEL